MLRALRRMHEGEHPRRSEHQMQLVPQAVFLGLVARADQRIVLLSMAHPEKLPLGLYRPTSCLSCEMQAPPGLRAEPLLGLQGE